jgi:hypothetical protein
MQSSHQPVSLRISGIYPGECQVDNAHLFPGVNRLPTLTFWVAPILIAVPFLVRSITRFAPKAAAPATPTPTAVRRDAADTLDALTEDASTRTGT